MVHFMIKGCVFVKCVLAFHVTLTVFTVASALKKENSQAKQLKYSHAIKTCCK